MVRFWGWLSGWLEFRGFIRQDMCVWPPKKRGRRWVVGGRRRLVRETQAWKQQRMSMRMHTNIYTHPPTRGKRKTYPARILSTINQILLHFSLCMPQDIWQAYGSLMSTQTPRIHTHTQAHSTEIFQAHLVGFVLWRAHFGVGGIITRIDIVATHRKRIQLLRTRLNLCI